MRFLVYSTKYNILFQVASKHLNINQIRRTLYTRVSQETSRWISRASGAFHLKLFLKETIPLVSVNLPPNKKQTHPQATRSRWFITYIVPTSGSVSIQVQNRGIPYVYPEVHCFIIVTQPNGFKRLATNVPYQSQPKVKPIQNHSGAVRRIPSTPFVPASSGTTLRIPCVPILLRTTCMEHSPLAVPHAVHTRDLGVLY